MVVTTAPDQQACILQFLLSSRNVFNGYTQPAVMMVINICSMQIYLLLIGLLIHCTPYVNSIFPLFLVILFFSNPSIKYFQVDFSRILIKKVCTFSKHAVTEFLVISFFQHTLAFITSLFLDSISAQSRNFYENNMIIRSSQK